MQDLTPVGLSKDGSKLVLISTRGVEFAVAVDQRLRDALRGDQNRLGQLEMTMESTLRPRDIQSRIRSGETAEAVASAANTSVDKIMIYAGPVLAERAHIAQSAQVASIRRKNADSTSARTLSDAGPPYFREAGTRPDDVEWDAWRRDDGRWTVVAQFTQDDKPQRAEFTYDVPGRYVVADNEVARRVTGESRSAPAAAPARGGRRLSAVPNQDQLPLGDDLGDDALAMVREGGALTEDHADADWMGTGRTADEEVTEEIHVDRAAEAPAEDLVDGAAPVDEPTAPTETAAWLEEPSESTEPPAPDTSADTSGDTGDESAASEPAPEPEPEPEDESGQRKPKSKKRGRAQVPSWDEIMFGGGGKGD